MPEWLIILGTLGGQIFTAGAIYGAIKGDIKGAVKDAAHARDCALEAKDSSTEAHQRIDKILMRG